MANQRTATYLPTGLKVFVGRRLKDDNSEYFMVTPTDPKPGDYVRSYQATPQELRYDSVNNDPQSPGSPTGLVVPFAPNSPPEAPRVPREQEPPSGVDPSSLIWVNDPELGEDYIANKIKGIGVLSARKIIEVRDQEHGGRYTSVDDIPLRIDSLKKYFSLVRINQDPALG
jgi:hypothetical protein